MARALLLLLLLLAGCAGRRDYPSLLPRAIETRNDAEPRRAAPQAAPDPALDARIATAEAVIEATRARFATAAERAALLVAQAQRLAPGSSEWLDAQGALGDLDALRAETSAQVSELELLTIERAAAGMPAYPALDAAYARAKAALEAQAGQTGVLSAQLPTG